MTNRNRTNPVQFYLSDDEQYILNTKFKASGMKSMSAFLRKLILYGYVYDVDYSYLRNYNTELGRISSNLNQIAKMVNSTGNIYQEDINEVKELMNEVYLPAFDTIPIALVCSIHLIGIITNLFNPASLLTASNCTRLKSRLCSSSQTVKNILYFCFASSFEYQI